MGVANSGTRLEEFQSSMFCVMSTMMTTANKALHMNAVMVSANEKPVVKISVAFFSPWREAKNDPGVVQRSPGYRLRVSNSTEDQRVGGDAVTISELREATLVFQVSEQGCRIIICTRARIVGP